MDIPFLRWYSVVHRRRSRRHFDLHRPIESGSLAALEKMCEEFRPFPHARAYLVSEPVKDIFKGIVGGYGKVSGVPAFIAFIGDMRAPSVQEEVGYTGEGIILEATALGLNTCWVAGFFRPGSVASLVEIKDNERVLAVTPVGYASRFESLTERLMTGYVSCGFLSCPAPSHSVYFRSKTPPYQHVRILGTTSDWSAGIKMPP